MAEVDIVLAHYDPAVYGDKMSGIVPEAVCLGKPVLVADGCNAVINFLDRYAPGGFVVAPYSTHGLASALALQPAVWTACAPWALPASRSKPAPTAWKGWPWPSNAPPRPDSIS